MITRIRIEATGASASEVEQQLLAVADALNRHVKLQAVNGEQLIARELEEPDGHTAFSGRLILHPNVASDSPQAARFREWGLPVTTGDHRTFGNLKADERNAVAWLSLTDEELGARQLSREAADDIASTIAGDEYVGAWITANRGGVAPPAQAS